MKQKNKWGLELKDHYICGEQTIIRTELISIIPTSGDRTDLIIELDGDRTYIPGMTKEQFMERLTKEEYLDKCLPGLEDEDRIKALKNVDWTPRRHSGYIAVIIEIKNGNVNLKAK